ncbi:MAG: histone deacetylase [Deltaproteobacteria bacterium]|nr:histone deacetylase [Deltaproteobacteria bacterium]
MTKKTGIVKDIRYLKHGTAFMEPETSKRLLSIYTMLESSGMKDKLIDIEPRYAEISELALFHETAYIDMVAGTAGKKYCSLDPDTGTTEDSYDVARLAVGGVCNAVDRVLTGDCDNAFALVRPPGHHAEPGRAAGFCIFNNIVIGALYALTRRDVHKILIVDWDLHHGNGTQNAFYSDNRVLYFSIHEYPSYPGTGAAEEIGRDGGEGYNINIPLAPGAGDADYLAITGTVLEPVANEFKPDLIMVSAGFDIYHRDPLGGMKVTEKGFAALTRVIMNIADRCCRGKLVATLEGGYHIGGLTGSVKAVLHELLNETPLSEAELDDMERDGLHRQDSVIKRVRENIEPFWPVFK